MPTGSANQKTITSYTLQGDSPREDDPINTDEQRNEDSNNIAQASKRRRGNEVADDQLTDDDMNLLDVNALLPSDGSAASIFSNESRTTIVNNPDQVAPMEPREYRAPARSTYLDDDDAERLKIIKLERLKDKEDRYSSHIQFLKECHEARIIPKGLRLEIEPSIGNNDHAFCEKWYKRLEDCSLALMKDAIEYCERIEDETSKTITTQSDELKAILGPTEHRKLTDHMSEISSQRRQRLQAAKRKKYQHLRYNRTERPERQEPQTNSRRKEERNAPRGNQAISDDDRPRRQQRGNTTRRARDTYDYSSDDDNDRRQTRFRPARRENTYTSDHRNQDRLYEGERNRDASGSRVRTQETRRRDVPHIQVSDTDPPRGKQYRDILMSAHSRPGSRTNLQRSSNHNLSRKSSFANNRPANDAKDEEIRRLQHQLKEATSSKNGARLPPPPPPNETPRDKKTEEAMNFITQTMKALEAFKEQLSR